MDDLVRQGVRQVIGQAIEAELGQLLEQYESVCTLNGTRAMMRTATCPNAAY